MSYFDVHFQQNFLTFRHAGFSEEEARTAAACAQYVDDNLTPGEIKFTNGLKLKVENTALSLDPGVTILDNLDKVKARVWAQFHFTPSDITGYSAPGNPSVNALMDWACKQQDLTIFGICSHIYNDSWAHYGFIGASDPKNVVSMKYDTLVEEAKSIALGKVLPLGHGPASNAPDRCALTWSYTTKDGKTVTRNNWEKVVEGQIGLAKYVQRFKGLPEVGLSQAYIDEMTATMKVANTKGDDTSWAQRYLFMSDSIAKGNWGIPATNLTYDGLKWQPDAMAMLKVVNKMCYTADPIRLERIAAYNSQPKELMDAIGAVNPEDITQASPYSHTYEFSSAFVDTPFAKFQIAAGKVKAFLDPVLASFGR